MLLYTWYSFLELEECSPPSGLLSEGKVAADEEWRLARGLALAVAGETPTALLVGFVRFLLASKVWESLRS